MNVQDQFDILYSEIKHNKAAFIGVFFVVVLVTYGILFALDFIPEPKKTSDDTDTEEVRATFTEEVKEIEPVVQRAPLPRKIIFDSLGREINVLNPESRAIADLDAALLNGVVRHPDSAELTTDGNVFILGHSSYLPTVFNKNYQAFNGIQDLTWGDTVRLQSDDTEYIYRVQKVYKASASEVIVPFTPGKAKLTLATCNSFGSKDDRFIVEADLIDTKEL